MFRPKPITLALALAFGLPLGAQAQSTEEIDNIRKQVQELKDDYENRIQGLEKRLKDAEQSATAAQRSASQAEARTQSVAPKQASQNAFNPAISLILDGTYGNFKQDPTKYAITGFQPPGATSPGDRSFSLGESELFVTANADHEFMGALNLSLHGDDTVTVEEAYFQTIALGHGLVLKGGRYFLGIGYQNSIHAHAWDFVDESLVQRAFLGGNYGDDGLQLTWVAPVPLFVELGGSVGRGRVLVGTFDPPNDRNKNGAGSGSVFLHVGDDVGVSNSYRAGLSYLQMSTATKEFPLADFDTTTFTNTEVKLYGADFVWKWAPNGNYQYQNFKFVAEWFQIHREGDLTSAAVTGPFTQHQSGWYMQGAYQFHPYWRAGLRYDELEKGSFDGGVNFANITPPAYTPKRYSAMIDWNPSEFSRIRVQYNEDKSQQNLTDHQILLQYIYSLGTHGAHKF
jgi:outer membrane murein-binding lipoprotein Lpp